MLPLPQPLAAVSPLVVAAVLLAARRFSEPLGLPCPSVAQILAATEASRSRAYELSAELLEYLSTLPRPVGRPPRPPSAPSCPTQDEAIASEVLRYVRKHPGSVQAHSQRQRYSDEFRHFLLALRERYPDVELERFAELAQLPLGTLKSWFCSEDISSRKQSDGPPETYDSDAESEQVKLAQFETVLSAWETWEGTFAGFCEHLRQQLRIPFGRQLIGHILEANGQRQPQRRPGRSPDEAALRGAFTTFFSGAQWVGDGKTVVVTVGQERHAFNLELNVDANSGAFVGLTVSDTEDSAAVLEAFQSGVATTGAPPLALLLDNRPSNFTDEVRVALGETQTIRATTERPQNKAHVEGAFGLFSQTVPTLSLDLSQDTRAVARAFLTVVATTWARATNRKPRQDRAGRSRVEPYSDQVSEDEIAAAREALAELCKKQELARVTREARQRPEVREWLDRHIERLGLLDPERRVRIALGRYPLDALVAGVALFEAKKGAGTLPEGADVRYLLGIVRNVSAQEEGEYFAEALMRLRLEARDLLLAPLVKDREEVCHPSREGVDIVAACVDRALSAERTLDRQFWLGALAENLRGRSAEQRDALLLAAARRIHATFRVAPRERQDAVRYVNERAVPLT